MMSGSKSRFTLNMSRIFQMNFFVVDILPKSKCPSSRFISFIKHCRPTDKVITRSYSRSPPFNSSNPCVVQTLRTVRVRDMSATSRRFAAANIFYCRNISRPVLFLSRFRSTSRSNSILHEEDYQDGNKNDEKIKIDHASLMSAAGALALTVGAITIMVYRNGFTTSGSESKTKPKPKRNYFQIWPRSVSAAEVHKFKPGELKPGLPTYTAEEVSKHVSKDKRVWVIYKSGVYDITEYVNLHPGGKKILMAAGRSMEPFWEKYSVHHNDVIYEMMEYFRIGNLEEVKEQKKKTNRDSDVQPWMKPDEKRLGLELIERAVIMSVDELKQNFKKQTVKTSVKCSNSKTEKTEVTWSGVCLGDLMRAQGVDVDNVNSQWLVFESRQKKPDGTPYLVRYPMSLVKSMKEEILIAYEADGQPLAPLQGKPFRVILKGHGGGKQVKWLKKIRFSTEEEDQDGV